MHSREQEMRIAAVQMLVNNPHVIFGSTDVVDDFIEIPSPEASLVKGGHLAVRTRAQVAPVLIQVWRGPHPDLGTVVFDGPTYLPDGSLFVLDVERSTIFSRKCGPSGSRRLTVRVDEVGEASRVDLVLDVGENRMELSRIGTYPLPAIAGVSDPLAPADILNLILSDFDRPKARLVTAMDLVIHEWVADTSPRAAVHRSSRVRQIVEWMRSAFPLVGLGELKRVGSLIDREVADIADGRDDEIAVRISEGSLKGLL
ncbi:hypothetical protein [Streptomyces cavourensis]|uniref:hypothetical protein n=2 Tax=Streptomyces cavourensis TaxID=67258 RepID=UPI0020C991F3|nr:hypothetical protein [Streptomyces cavourensis]